MTYVRGGLIQANDHNTRLNIINNVWSTGSASYGWGQVSLATVTVGELVEAGLAGSPVEWASLVTTLNNISTHEVGSSAGITVPVTYDLIAWISSFDSNMNTLCDVGGLTENRFGNYAAFDDQIVSTSNYSQSWGNPAKPQIQNVASIVWGTSNQARYFFNAGGRVNLSISYSGGGSPQNTNWATVCSNAGTMWVQANSSGGTASNGFGYWQSPGRMYSGSGSGAYSSNTLTVDVSGQGTSQLQFTTTFRDNHTNIWSDIVTGTFTVTILVRRPPMRGLLTNSWGLGTVSFSGAGWSGGSTPVVTITLSPSTLPAGTVSTGYNQTITASGGTGPYTYSVASGALPSGLTLSSGGVLSGTPTTASSYSFTIQATDSLGNTGTQAYALTIAAPAVTITLSPSTLPSGTVGTGYSQIITASGGTSPYNYTVISGALPSGLNLSSGGIISGTPTTVSSYGFTIQAADILSYTGTRAYSVTIDAPPAPAIGQPYGGGYFAGVYCAGGNNIPTHYLIVSPFSTGTFPGAMNNFVVSGFTGDAAWATTSAIYDGYTATYATPSGFAAVQQIKNLTIGGYTDWYIPSLAELQIAFKNLRPLSSFNDTNAPMLGNATRPNIGGATAGNAWAYPIQTTNYLMADPAQTTASLFQVTGSESFLNATNYNGTYEYMTITSWTWDSQFTVDFLGGTNGAYSNGTPGIIRAFRKVPI